MTKNSLSFHNLIKWDNVYFSIDTDLCIVNESKEIGYFIMNELARNYNKWDLIQTKLKLIYKDRLSFFDSIPIYNDVKKMKQKFFIQKLTEMSKSSTSTRSFVLEMNRMYQISKNLAANKILKNLKKNKKNKKINNEDEQDDDDDDEEDEVVF